MDGGELLTYAEWERRSDAVAACLSRRIGRSDRVALLFDGARWIDYAVAHLAVNKAGGVAVPLRSGLGEIELARVLRHCGPSAVLAAPALAPRAGSVPILNPAELEVQGGALPPAAPRAAALAHMLYRSRPLGPAAQQPHTRTKLLEEPAPLLHAFPPGGLAAQEALRGCLAGTGTSAVVLPEFDAVRVCSLIEAAPERTCGLHPATAAAVLASGATERHDVSGLSRLVLASGPAPAPLLMRLADVFPLARLVLFDIPGVGVALHHDRSHPGALGRPSEPSDVWVLDEGGEAVAPGELGQLCGGPLRGYVDDRGFVYLAPGRDAVVRARGRTILNAEVEAALRGHPAVRDAALLGAPHDRGGPDLAVAVALARPTSAAELQALVRHRLGPEKTPGRVVAVDELPRSASGVLLRTELWRRLGLDGDGDGEGAGGPEDALRDPDAAVFTVRETVVAVWKRVLGREDLPPDADFFELGGGGEAMAGALRLLQDAVGVAVAPSTLLDAPTVVALSEEIARLRARTGSLPVGDPVAPVAFSQEGMVWHELFAPGCQNLPGLARRYRGPLDHAALKRALDEIVRRHGALRTGFELRHGRLVQVVRPHQPLDVEVRDLSALTARQRDRELARVVAEAGRLPFDLALDPLFVPTLLRLGEQDHVLVIRTHHSVFDDWSVGVFRRQLAKLYNAYVAGEASPLPEPALQFVDFSRRQRADLAGPAGARELAFWRRELAGAPLATQLSVDDPSLPAGVPQRGGDTVPLTLGAEFHGQLRALARGQRATLFMTMLAAFGVLVHRYTGQDDLVIATVVANRNRTELEGLIGCFTKKVPVRLRLDGDPPFAEVISRARESLLGALSHQDLPFEAVVQDVLGSAAAAHGLVPHVALMFQGVTPPQELVLKGVQSAGLGAAARAGRAHFMAGEERAEAELPPPPWGSGLYAGTFVILSLDESGEELALTARGAFHAPAVRGLLERFGTLLASVVADPGRPISELALLDQPATAQASDLGRGPSASKPADTLPGAFRAQVRRAPDAVAARTRTDVLTYAELDERSEALAARLRAAGTGRGSRVGTVLKASLQLIVAVLGIWKAGAAWVGLDPKDGGERRGRILGDAAVETLIGAEGFEPVDPPVEAPPACGRAEDAAVLFYGSGSAADHGVVLDHGALLNLVGALRDAIGPRRHACLCPDPTDDAFLRRLVGLLDGDTLYISERPLRADPGAAVRLLAAGEVELIDAAPEDLGALLGAGMASDLPEDIDAVVVIGTRGPVSPELLRAVRGASGVRLHVVYGPPECGFGATAAACSARGRGRPLANVAARVLDPHGCLVPVGAVGELHVGGPGLARGCCDESEQTRGRFALRGGERLYASGLLARLLADGSVELLGEGGDLELRGFRVEPARIEAALASCPGLGEVEVVLERDERGEPRLVVSALAHGTAPTLARLRAYLWERLPGYALPSRLVVRGAGAANKDEASELAEERVLSVLWAAELGVDRLEPEANYWQVFSFLDALASAREAGVAVLAEDVTRNRTVGTLATAMSVATATRAPRAY